MPPKAAKSEAFTANEMMLMSIIKRGGVSGIKWDDVATDVNDGRTGNAIRQKYQKMRGAFDKRNTGGRPDADSDDTGDEDAGTVKPIAANKKRTTAAEKGVKKPATGKKERAPVVKKRKREVEVVEEPEAEAEADADEDEDGDINADVDEVDEDT